MNDRENALELLAALEMALNEITSSEFEADDGTMQTESLRDSIYVYIAQGVARKLRTLYTEPLDAGRLAENQAWLDKRLAELKTMTGEDCDEAHLWGRV